MCYIILGALTQAIKSFAGGVVIISHNKEFTDAVCNEGYNIFYQYLYLVLYKYRYIYPL